VVGPLFFYISTGDESEAAIRLEHLAVADELAGFWGQETIGEQVGRPVVHGHGQVGGTAPKIPRARLPDESFPSHLLGAGGRLVAAAVLGVAHEVLRRALVLHAGLVTSLVVYLADLDAVALPVRRLDCEGPPSRFDPGPCGRDSALNGPVRQRPTVDRQQAGKDRLRDESGRKRESVPRSVLMADAELHRGRWFARLGWMMEWDDATARGQDECCRDGEHCDRPLRCRRGT